MTLLEEKDIRSLRRATNYKSIPFVKIKAVKEQRYRYDPGNQMRAAADVAKFAYPLFKDMDREQLICINFDNAMQPCAVELIALGAVNRCGTDIANIFKYAVLSNALSIILLHNHPTGSLVPSDDDIEFTKNVYKAGELLGIHLQDHIIMGDDQQYFSFRENLSLWD